MRQTIARIRPTALAAMALLASDLSALAASPSFDCAKATTQVEKTICSDPDLAALDVKVAAAFKQAMAQSTAVERHDLLISETTWLKQRDNCSNWRENGTPITIPNCIRYQYGINLTGLLLFMSDRAAGQTEVIFNGELRRAHGDDPIIGPSKFNSSLGQWGVGGRLISCSVVMEIPVSRYETGVGGSCILQDREGKKKQVLVCNDTGVGRFKLIPAGTQPASRHDVAQFAADNCTGG